MAQSLSASVHCSPIHTTTRSSLTPPKPNNTPNVVSCLNVHTTKVSCLSCQQVSLDDPTPNVNSPVSRRNVITLGVVSAVLGINLREKNAWAGARRPPPAPIDQEKKDPNLSGVQAKVLASRKRKEAMKQAMAQQRERGKKIEE